MVRPHFTQEEEYLIASCLLDRRSFFSFDVAYLVPSYVLAAYGWATGQIDPFVVALGVIACCKVWELLRQRKWTPLWKSVLRKYEAALTDTTDKPVV